MATYLFTPNAALDTSSELDLVTKKLEQSLDDLEAKVTAFAAANDGQSPDQYNAAQAKWNAAQLRMNAALQAGRIALDNIHQKYVLADNQGAAAFGQTM